VLNERPSLPMLGANVANQISRLIAEGKLRHLEDGPIGGTPIYFGDHVVGHALNAPLSKSGTWNLARIADFAIAQSAFQLAKHGKVWLPGMKKSNIVSVPITTVEAIGEIGPYHADVFGRTASGGVRGPFELVLLSAKSAPTYPVLWAHDADRERTMLFDADHEGIPLHGSSNDEQLMIDERLRRYAGLLRFCISTEIFVSIVSRQACNARPKKL
jgi:hypothetical protein